MRVVGGDYLQAQLAGQCDQLAIELGLPVEALIL